MISLPLGEAAVSAILFLISEFVLVPVFTACTSMWAYYLLICKCRYGKKVNISPLRLPFFSDGLLSNFPLHYVILLLRITIVSVPVYLGLRLTSRTEPILKEVKVESSFSPAPRTDFYEYEDEVKIAISFLRELSTLTYDACMEFDEDGWATAGSSQVDMNFTNSTLSYSGPICLPGTQIRLFRNTGSIPGLNAENNGLVESLDGEYQLNVTWHRGEKSWFPPSIDLDRYESDTSVLKTDNLSINLTDVECFSSSGSYYRREFGIGEYSSDIVCHNITGNKVEFLGVGSIWIPSNENNSVSKKEVTNLKGSDMITLYRVGELEFADKILFNASHFVSNPGQQPIFDYEGFETALRLLLYTQSFNKTFYVESGKTRPVTMLDSTFLIIASIYVGVVLMGGLLTFLYTTLSRNVHIRPNTLSGLSTLWAAHHERKRGTGIDKKQWIELARDASVFGVYSDGFFEPAVDLRT